MIPEIFRKDWFEGRTNEYISTDSSKSIGWENSLSNYSEFLFDEAQLERLLNDNNLIIEELNGILSAMGVTAIVGFKSNVETAYTDGMKITIDKKFIPLKNTDSLDYIYYKFDVLIGLLIHEACHCKYTDFDYCHKNRDLINNVIHSIHNVLEDESIERNIGLNFPGYSNFIKAMKKEIFKYQLNHGDIEWNNDELTDIFNLLLITVRYPEKLNIVPETVLEQYAELFEKIYNILDFKGLLQKKENFTCTRDTLSAAIAIFNLLNITEETSENDNNSEENSENENGENDGEEDGWAKIKKITLDKATDSLDGSMISLNNKGNIDSKSETTNKGQEIEFEKDLIFEDFEGTGQFGWKGGLGVNENIKEFGKSNILVYNKLYGDIKHLIDDFRKVIVPTNSDDQFKKIDFQRSGQLDPNQIVTALQGGRFVNTKIQRTTIKRKPKYALVLNLDESSSMFGDNIGKNIRIGKNSPYGIASRLAVLFYEAMKDYKDLEIYIYGHGDNINRYIFPKRNTDKYVLGHRQLQNGQHDSKSIDAILTEVRANTTLPIIMVNITDSLYLAGVYDMTSLLQKFNDVAFTLMCVSEISKKHMTDEHKKINDTIYGEGNWVTIDDKTNMKMIAIQLAKVFREKFKVRDKK